MANPHNPFDQTIWDPSGEHAIEDPFHGPSAIHQLLNIPAMPNGNGRYHQPGSYYVNGTPYLDSEGRPVFVFGMHSISSFMSGNDELREWLDTFHQGGESALLELETKRQQERLETNGFAHCFKPTDVCPGGKQLQDCTEGNEAFEGAAQWRDKNTQEKPGEGEINSNLSWLGKKCGSCALSCEVSVKAFDGIPTETRVTYYRPNPDLQTYTIEVAEDFGSSVTNQQLADAYTAAQQLYGKTAELETHNSPKPIQ